jgi:hypothetical protein
MEQSNKYSKTHVIRYMHLITEALKDDDYDAASKQCCNMMHCLTVLADATPPRRKTITDPHR